MSTARPVPPEELTNLDIHPAWNTTVNPNTEIVVFSLYTEQLPVDVPKRAWRESPDWTCRVGWDDDRQSYAYESAMIEYGRRADVELPDDPMELQNELERRLQEDIRESKGLQYPILQLSNHGSRFPQPLISRLLDRYDSHYELLNAPRDELLSIEGLGETMYDRLYNAKGTKAQANWPPDWCGYGTCPECGEEWCIPVGDLRRDATFETLQELAYCPACLKHPLPDSYLVGPLSFLDS